MSRSKKPVRPVVSYPREAVVDYAQAAAGLGVSEALAKKMDLPTVYIAPRVQRLVWGQVLDVLMERAA